MIYTVRRPVTEYKWNSNYTESSIAATQADHCSPVRASCPTEPPLCTSAGISRFYRVPPVNRANIAEPETPAELIVLIHLFVSGTGLDKTEGAR